MPKASEVASELRKLADSLDREPDTDVPGASLTLWCMSKESFLDTSRLLPRPLVKGEEKIIDKYRLSYGDEKSPLYVRCLVSKSLACKLVKPAQEAVYECLPVLSEAEEAALETNELSTEEQAVLGILAAGPRGGAA